MQEMKISNSIVFPISELNRSIVDAIPTMPAQPKWPALQAVRHLNRAWKIRELDPEMAIFRSITAEEEAATAVFHSLRRRGYEGANKLKPRDHIHKNAVIPFFEAITRVLAKVGQMMPSTQLCLDCNNKPPLLIVRFEYIDPVSGEKLWAHPQPPLHFSLKGGPADGEMKTEDFSDGINDIVNAMNMNDIIEYLRNRANQRNQILYAGADGYPSIGGDVDKALELYQRHVFVLLRMYFLIDPYKDKQLFVQQALYAFLKMLNLIPKEVVF